MEIKKVRNALKAYFTRFPAVFGDRQENDFFENAIAGNDPKIHSVLAYALLKSDGTLVYPDDLDGGADLTEITSRVTAAENDITALEGTVATLGNEVDAIDTRVEELEASLEATKFSCIANGDTIGQSINPNTSTRFTGWASGHDPFIAYALGVITVPVGMTALVSATLITEDPEGSWIVEANLMVNGVAIPIHSTNRGAVIHASVPVQLSAGDEISLELYHTKISAVSFVGTALQSLSVVELHRAA